MKDDLLYQIALTLIPNIGPAQAKCLLQEFNVQDIFKAKLSSLEKIEGIGRIRAQSIKNFNQFSIAEKELNFIDKCAIKTSFFTDNTYPQRLQNVYDPPMLLYYRGNAHFNTSKIISIVGTRQNSEYGKIFTEQLITALANEQITVISGLAQGIDGIAHKAALQNKLPTIGVLAHGLKNIYPAAHKKIAEQMQEQGAVLTEYRYETIAEKFHFPTRNRIVAGLSDATIVIETLIKGGSMITAEIANSYHKDVFALPGKTTDSKSAGCNYLIKNHKAFLITEASDLLNIMGWNDTKKAPPQTQRSLFTDLTIDEQTILNLLTAHTALHIDDINQQSRLSTTAVAAAILNLELAGILISQPGKIYKLL